MRLEGVYTAASWHKPAVRAAGGKLLFPFLVDHTAGVALNESEQIVSHLWKHYGRDVQRPPLDRLLNGGLPAPLDFALLVVPSALRPWPHAGLMLAPSRKPGEPLILHGCESEAGSRLVREVLLHNSNAARDFVLDIAFLESCMPFEHLLVRNRV